MIYALVRLRESITGPRGREENVFRAADGFRIELVDDGYVRIEPRDESGKLKEGCKTSLVGPGNVRELVEPDTIERVPFVPKAKGGKKP